MVFDIIELSNTEVESLTTVQLKLLRTAQQKKNALFHQLQSDLKTYELMTYTNGVSASSLYPDKKAELEGEYEYQVEILREQLIFNMSLSEPTNGDETGDLGSDNAAYPVDYELSYLERYVMVRDYYMTIEDPDERLALLAADEVARKYLDSYYSTLYNYLYTFTTD
ncbi:MAG: hypothetical protein ACI4L9_01275 [Candidatus Coproplasma sp.]